ncbi:hypothetical protein [Fictibacillus gelatini]|uniref:hypothetical protein n=1 Tax=Fictibacillus gelatini TaxID=225985 RepID=UPI0004279C4B|nr:hypothetical protein [Fictibacillus gelatini]
MIYVNGMPVNASMIEHIKQLDQQEKQIAMKLINSREEFVYQTVRQLTFETKFRKNIVAACYALKKSNPGFASFSTARCNPAYWLLTRYGGFLLRPDVTPSAAINDIYINGKLYAFECTTGIMILLYKGVLDTIGEVKFNQLFRGLLLWSTEHDEDLQLVAVQGDSMPGDVLYIKNPEFHPLTPQWQGENIIDLGNGTYFGHGIGIGTLESIIEILNQRRRPGATVSAFLTNQIIRPNYRLMAEYTGHPIRRLLA